MRELVQPFAAWSNASIDRVVYCTARVSQADDAQASLDQAIYLSALELAGSVDLIEEGRYDSWAKEAPLAADSRRRAAPALYEISDESWDPRLPLRRTPDNHLLATIRKREEKGSDVNVATHLLHDVLTGAVEAAIVVSNDSDLELPLRFARDKVPVGTVNPSANYLAGALRGSANQGPGRHWWKQLQHSDFVRSQLSDPVGSFRKPAGW